MKKYFSGSVLNDDFFHFKLKAIESDLKKCNLKI